MDNFALLCGCKRRLLWASIAVALYGRAGYLDRVQVGV